MGSAIFAHKGSNSRALPTRPRNGSCVCQGDSEPPVVCEGISSTRLCTRCRLGCSFADGSALEEAPPAINTEVVAGCDEPYHGRERAHQD